MDERLIIYASLEATSVCMPTLPQIPLAALCRCIATCVVKLETNPLAAIQEDKQNVFFFFWSSLCIPW